MYLPQALSLDSTIESRQLGGGGYRYRTRRRTPWTRFGRWVLAGILIFLAIVFLFMFLCMSKRRKRQRQLRGTTQAPMAHHNLNNTQAGYGVDNNQAGYGNGNQYAAPPTYNNGNGAAGDYYGGQQSGVAQPGNAYVK